MTDEPSPSTVYPPPPVDGHPSPGAVSDVPTAEFDIYCPNCYYNLHGLPMQRDARCPECGRGFDWVLLRQWTFERGLSLCADPGGEDRRRTTWVFTDSLIHPTLLAHNLPPFPDTYAARLHVIAMVLSSPLPIFVALIPVMGPFAVLVTCLFLIGIIPTVALCHFMMSRLMAAMTRPKAVPTEAKVEFCVTFCRCFASHLPLSSVAGCIGFILELSRGLGNTRMPGTTTVLMVVAIPVVWWWLCLGRGICARTEPTTGRTTFLMALPVVTAVSIGIGIVCVYLVIEIFT